MGLDPKAFKKLQSCLVAADAACSRGDFPVVTVDTALAAVLGFATAADTATVPAELAAAVEALPSVPPIATIGAAQPDTVIRVRVPMRMLKKCNKKADPRKACDLLLRLIKQVVYLRWQTTLNTPAAQDSFNTGSNLLSGVLFSETSFPAPLPAENSLYSMGR